MILILQVHKNKKNIYDDFTIVNQETGEAVDFASFLKLKGQIFCSNLDLTFMLIVKKLIANGYNNVFDVKNKGEFSFIYNGGSCYNFKINTGNIIYLINFEKKFLQPFRDYETNKLLIDFAVNKLRNALSVGTDAFNEFIQGVYFTKHQKLTLSACKVIFRRDYPVIDDEILERAKENVSGYQIANKGHYFNCYNYDISSSYPAQLLNDTPVGELREFENFEDIPQSYFYIVKFSCFDIKTKPQKIDFLQINKKNYVTKVLTQHLYKLFLKTYDYTNLKIKRIVAFKTIANRFKNFVEQNAILGKELETNEFIKKYNKAVANSIVGYFGKNRQRRNTKCTFKNGKFKLEEEIEDVEPVYLPLYLYVTGKAKAEFIEDLNKISPTTPLIYANTDGIITTSRLAVSRLNFGRNSAIGYYKEKTPIKEIYIETINGYTAIDENGEIDNTLAGMTLTQTISVDQYEHKQFYYVVNEINATGDIVERRIHR